MSNKPGHGKKGRSLSDPRVSLRSVVLLAILSLAAAVALGILTGRGLGGEPETGAAGGIPKQGNVKGFKNAPVTIVEYSDFQ